MASAGGATCAVTLLGAAAGLGAALFGAVWLRAARHRQHGDGRLRQMLNRHRAPDARPARIRAGWRRRRPRWLVPELLLLPIGAAAGQGTASVLPLIGAACAVLPLRRWRARYAAGRAARRRAAAVIDLCAGLAAELRSGATPEQAMHAVVSRSAPDWARRLGPEPTARLAAGCYGADLPAALRQVAELPGGEGAAAIAACWRVSTESGTGLAFGLEQVADALRAERALAEEIAGELAGPRTTVIVLAALPAVGMGLGGALGAHPVQVLLHTPAGLLSLLAGAALEAAGIVWTARIVRAAEDAPARPHPVERAARHGPVRAAVGGCGISRSRQDRWLTAVPPLAGDHLAVRVDRWE
ncbi:type II secretion system F family protein [Kitasatospora sp. CB01950]|uniref:type II secretion system F family protein n=1 Tax=Kitasatospora sp. CB01950 TaxID=1703930 RepID=UPI00093DA22F|nr:type II secretion system F family protein [Kitasatospora sp. CB01950]